MSLLQPTLATKGFQKMPSWWTYMNQQDQIPKVFHSYRSETKLKEKQRLWGLC